MTDKIAKLRAHPRRPKVEHVHGLSGIVTIVAILWGWKYLPPYLLHNPGVQLILGGMIVEKFLRIFFKD